MRHRSTKPAADLLIVVDPAGALPLHRQVYAGLRDAIVEGRLGTGTQLPSTRALSAELHVARNTVTTAFEQLRAEGYVSGQRGGGTRVSKINPDNLLLARPTAASHPRPAPGPGVPPAGSAREQGRSGAVPFRLSPRGRRIVTAARLFPAAIDVPDAFSIGIPALEEFPIRLWSRLVARRWRRPPSLGTGDPAGYAPLRQAVAEYLRAARAVRCEAAQVVIVSGAQHGLDLAARLLLDPGDAAWVEDPGYPGARSALEAAGARLVPVPVDGEGILVSEGRRLEPGAHLVHVTPSHQFPLGATMSPDRRLELLAWAQEAGAWIVEDDYDSEFRYAGRPLPSLQGLDPHGRVLYLGTFSKTLFPALRLGYLVLPPALVDAFAVARSVGDRHPPLFDQAVVADFLEEGHFVRHLRRMRALYVERQGALVEAARRTLAGLLDVPPDQAGIHLVGRLPAGVDADDAAVSAVRHGVRVVPLSRYATGAQRHEALLLGYAAVSIPAIHRGVERLAAALRER
jgi:GntR family transcriptional regulator/MocR family aminotransferase